MKKNLLQKIATLIDKEEKEGKVTISCFIDVPLESDPSKMVFYEYKGNGIFKENGHIKTRLIEQTLEDYANAIVASQKIPKSNLN